MIDMHKNAIFNTHSQEEDDQNHQQPAAVPIRKDKIMQALENIGQRKIAIG